MADTSDERDTAVNVYVCQSGVLVWLNMDDTRDSDTSKECEFVDIPAVSVYSPTTVKLCHLYNYV